MTKDATEGKEKDTMAVPTYKPKVDEAGNVAMKDGFPVWTDDDGNESAFDVNDLSSRLLAANAESKKRKQRLREMEERLAPVKDVEDLSAFVEEAEKARETVRNLEEKDIRKAETVDKIKQEMRDGFKVKEDKLKSEFQNKLDQLQGTVDVKQKQIRQLMLSNKFAASELFSGANPMTTLPPAKAEACYGHHFKIEELDGGGLRLIAYYNNGEPVYSSERVGEYAEFDEAIQKLINLDPDRDRILRATGAGTGAGGGTGGVPRKDDLKSLQEQLAKSESSVERVRLTREIHRLQLQQLTGQT